MEDKMKSELEEPLVDKSKYRNLKETKWRYVFLTFSSMTLLVRYALHLFIM
jgi:hypothetical protein